MADGFIQSEQQQFVERLLRSGKGLDENAFVTSAGGRAVGFVAVVIGKYDYNHYDVRAVEVNGAGSIPVIVGNEVRAVNVAEPFLSQGSLPAGSCVIIFRIADKYVFYALV